VTTSHIDLTKTRTADFTDEIAPRRPFLILSLEGLDKSGKTNFGFTAPKPLLYQSTDFGDEGVIQKFSGQGQILRPRKGDYKLDVPTILDRTDPAAMQEVYRPVVERWIADYRAAIAMGVRTVVWDKASEFWQWIRLMHYGRQSAGQSNYQLTAQANSYYRDLVREAAVAGVNLLLLNELVPVFDSYREDGKVKFFKTDKLESNGNEKDPQLITARLRLRYHAPERDTDGAVTAKGKFTAEVRSCRDDYTLIGKTISSPDFLTLASLLVPAVTDIEAWGVPL